MRIQFHVSLVVIIVSDGYEKFFPFITLYIILWVLSISKETIVSDQIGWTKVQIDV